MSSRNEYVRAQARARLETMRGCSRSLLGLEDLERGFGAAIKIPHPRRDERLYLRRAR